MTYSCSQVSVGMYNVPSFTLARTIGGLLGWWWRSIAGWEETPLIVLASVRTAHNPTLQSHFLPADVNPQGFILGEGFLSIVNLIMQSLEVPTL